jgi:thiamine-monophosphate kinase
VTYLVSEDKFISQILPLLSKKNILQGNDDAVAWKQPVGEENSLLVLNTDSIGWSSDALPKTMSYFQFGMKLVTVTVSDVIAKGAKPYFFLCTITISSDMNEENITQLFNGIQFGCKKYELEYMGGDLGSAKELVLTGIVVGYVKENLLLKRSTMKDHDYICSTGNFGFTGLGYKIYLENLNLKLPKQIAEIVDEKLLQPKARLDWLHLLQKYANATIDSSDGLFKSLIHLAQESKKQIILKKLPVFSELTNIFQENTDEYLRTVLFAGEEFEIIFSITQEKYAKLLSELENLPIMKPILIGEVSIGSPNVIFLDKKLDFSNNWDSFTGFTTKNR